MGIKLEFAVSDNFDEGDSDPSEGRLETLSTSSESVSFGDYAVLAPGVQIILEGRTISSSGR